MIELLFRRFDAACRDLFWFPFPRGWDWFIVSILVVFSIDSDIWHLPIGGVWV